MDTDHQPSELSSVAENYLLCLYMLSEEGVETTFRELSARLRSLPEGERLGTSTSSVAGMLRRMAKEGLVSVTPSKEVVLTASGAHSAKDMVRRHRIAERMVVDLLGVELHRAHIEAHRLEHAISPELLESIVKKLGNPQKCPFGGPIPGSGYSKDTRIKIPLDKAKINHKYFIDRVPEEDTVLIQYLVEKEILPDKVIAVSEKAAYRGIIVVQGPSGGAVPLGVDVANRILITEEAPNE
jgi:DtxR family Mn-dependent transcriptional regulator